WQGANQASSVSGASAPVWHCLKPRFEAALERLSNASGLASVQRAVGRSEQPFLPPSCLHTELVWQRQISLNLNASGPGLDALRHGCYSKRVAFAPARRSVSKRGYPGI